MLGYRLEAVELKNNLSLPQSKLMLPLSSHLGKSDIRLLADPTVQTTTSILWCFPSLKQRQSKRLLSIKASMNQPLDVTSNLTEKQNQTL